MTPDEIAELRSKSYNATVASIAFPNEDLMIVRVRPDGGVQPHRPGQYSTLGLGQWEPRVPGCQEEVQKPGDEKKLIRRAYSISCSMLDEAGTVPDRSGQDWLEFYIVLVRHAEKAPPALTPRLFVLREGSRLFMGEKIAGHYTLDPVKPTDNVLFLSTGTGEAPHNYMLWQLLRSGHQGKILSACCVRYQRDLGYLAIHQELTRRFPNYTYLSLTTREATSAGQKVYIQDLITSGQLEGRLGDTLDPARTHVYLCGNPKMIGVPEISKITGDAVFPQPPGVIEILTQRGFQRDQASLKLKGNIHVEEYW
ncbi:MAG: ferredoxin--NADP reductase [Planctomycetes bacterium]|nr:ferredoxin--NADP reductase [Planctomycetota bacterium]